MCLPVVSDVHVGLQPEEKTVLPLTCDLESLIQYSAVIRTSVTIFMSDVGAGDLGLWYEVKQCISGKSLESSCCSISHITVPLFSVISYPVVVP